jgi:hypothetical protein
LKSGETAFSPIQDSGLGTPGPIQLSVSSPTASHFRTFNPTNSSVALALTVYETEILGQFRIGVTNLSKNDIKDFTIRWFALRA